MDPTPPSPPEPPLPPPHIRHVLIVITTIIVSILFVIFFIWVVLHRNEKPSSTPAAATPSSSLETPVLTTQVVLRGRTNVWDLAFLPSKEMLFTERKGTLSLIKDGQVRQLAQIADVRATGEGGLLGVAVDPNFATNRYIYTCYNSQRMDVRIVRWTINAALTELADRHDIVTGAPANTSGRHSGCRLHFGLDGYLWIGTGDTAQNLTPQSPQDPKSLGGKILRVDRDGKGASGNLGGTFDSRIYSYGHRNTQGIAFFADLRRGVSGVSVEHGSDKDDEINPLKPGNFGWAPPNGPYDEAGPMTDTARFPDAVNALWSSGTPTQAPSGVAVLQGAQWKAWNGAMAVAMLKGQHLKILTFDGDTLKIKQEIKQFEKEFGRLRAAVQGSDGSLYLSTDNGTNDKIIRVTPQ